MRPRVEIDDALVDAGDLLPIVDLALEGLEVPSAELIHVGVHQCRAREEVFALVTDHGDARFVGSMAFADGEGRLDSGDAVADDDIMHGQVSNRKISKNLKGEEDAPATLYRRGVRD